MSSAVPSDVTKLLSEWSRGNQTALAELTPLVYRDLHQRARNYLRHERPDHTLQPTALIHEAYLRLSDDKPPEWSFSGEGDSSLPEPALRLVVERERVER